ncbi:MAG: hypothetical protein HZB53_01180 [Chloroflexi bacterium]|nr:hypothetical protein [Chloroflexota bacterium]
MEIHHRLTFNHKDNVDQAIDSLRIKSKRSPLPSNGYLLHIDIVESDPNWLPLSALAKEKLALDVYDTIFTDAEIRAAPWVRLVPTYQQGYPHPQRDLGTNPANYENFCPLCGAGFIQKTPFNLVAEPKLGKHDFLTLHWAYAVLTTDNVFSRLDAANIKGHEKWNVDVHRTGKPSQFVSQLYVPSIAKPSLLNAHGLRSEMCRRCGITKKAVHMRGLMSISRGSLHENVDIQLSHEWFGSGHSGFREVFISNRFAQIILEQKWQGLRLKPIQLL